MNTCNLNILRNRNIILIELHDRKVLIDPTELLYGVAGRLCRLYVQDAS